jgi:hypothetical protein
MKRVVQLSSRFRIPNPLFEERNRQYLQKESPRRNILLLTIASDKPFVAEACPPMSHASASNRLSDIETHNENTPCNRPLSKNTEGVHNRLSQNKTFHFPQAQSKKLLKKEF